MGRFWSLLFLSVPILGVATFVCAIGDIWPFSGPRDGSSWTSFPAETWLPLNINEDGRVIDNLFNFVLYLTGIIFIGTGIALFWFLWKYDADKNPEPVKYTHGSHTLEIVWSILPAAALLFIAIYQMNAWADQKLRYPTEQNELGQEVRKRPWAVVTGRQFEWRIQYAGPDGVIGMGPGKDGIQGTDDDEVDDLFTVNELRVPANETVVLQIESRDVLHSFFLPNLRLKQDVVPGMKQFVWCRANQEGYYDIVCAELCGWGHYKMRGQLVIVRNEKTFWDWYKTQRDEQERAEYNPETKD